MELLRTCESASKHGFAIPEALEAWALAAIAQDPEIPPPGHPGAQAAATAAPAASEPAAS